MICAAAPIKIFGVNLKYVAALAIGLVGFEVPLAHCDGLTGKKHVIGAAY